MRQTLFDVLQPHIEGARFLDLCAGAGTIGLEAASRGAAAVVLVERERRTADLIRRNAGALGPDARITVLCADGRKALPTLARHGARFDVIFLDPPYESGLYETLLRELDRLQLVAEGGVVVAEHFHKRPLPERIGALSCHRYIRVGDHHLSFYGVSHRTPAEKGEP